MRNETRSSPVIPVKINKFDNFQFNNLKYKRTQKAGSVSRKKSDPIFISLSFTCIILTVEAIRLCKLVVHQKKNCLYFKPHNA